MSRLALLLSLCICATLAHAGRTFPNYDVDMPSIIHSLRTDPSAILTAEEYREAAVIVAEGTPLEMKAGMAVMKKQLYSQQDGITQMSEIRFFATASAVIGLLCVVLLVQVVYRGCAGREEEEEITVHHKNKM